MIISVGNQHLSSLIMHPLVVHYFVYYILTPLMSFQFRKKTKHTLIFERKIEFCEDVMYKNIIIGSLQEKPTA